MTTVFKGLMLRRPVAGDLGIEIEVEGSRLPLCEHYWINEKDGSLKGLETREYVLAKPSSLDMVKKALDYLDKLYITSKTKVDDSVRAGVHVHVNCQKLTMTQLFTFMALYFTLENVLTKWCGQSREGNLFCLRASDAEGVLTQIKNGIVTKRWRDTFGRDKLRYAAMNVKALATYGSLEFRAMRGTRDLDLVYLWASVLLGLREKSMEFENPTKIIEQFSVLGPTGFMKEVLGDNYKHFVCEEQEEMLWEGVRNAQDIAYCVQWNKYEPKVRTIGQIDFPVDNDPDEPDEDF